MAEGVGFRVWGVCSRGLWSLGSRASRGVRFMSYVFRVEGMCGLALVGLRV